MSKCILDSSALLALLMDEKGSDIIMDKIDYAIMSSVNYAEVIEILSRKMEITEVSGMLQKLITHIEPFNQEDAINAGKLHQLTKQHGLSLGDRACISLGRKLGLEVYTADKIWSKIAVNVKIIIIRN